jgi:uncharacterized protein (TIGR00255 family)
MTGFARLAGSEDWGRWVWEARSVNGKTLDLRLNLPSGLDAVEAFIRKSAPEHFARGSLQISLKIDLAVTNSALKVNMEALKALTDAYQDIDGTLVTGPALANLMTIKGVIETDASSTRDLTENKVAIEQLSGTGAELLKALAASRAKEGAALADILTAQLSEIETYVAQAVTFAAEQRNTIATRYTTRLKELDTEGVVSDERLAAEIAIIASKADVVEELDRLHAHIETGRDFLAADGAIGRNLGFLAQELNREANTLCAKSASLGLTNAGLALKSVIDQFKEQAANVE